MTHGRFQSLIWIKMIVSQTKEYNNSVQMKYNMNVKGPGFTSNTMEKFQWLFKAFVVDYSFLFAFCLRIKTLFRSLGYYS